VHDATGTLNAPIFERASLGVGDQLSGPAIITQLDATVLLALSWHAEVLGSGALLLRKQ